MIRLGLTTVLLGLAACTRPVSPASPDAAEDMPAASAPPSHAKAPVALIAPAAPLPIAAQKSLGIGANDPRLRLPTAVPGFALVRLNVGLYGMPPDAPPPMAAATFSGLEGGKVYIAAFDTQVFAPLTSDSNWTSLPPLKVGTRDANLRQKPGAASVQFEHGPLRLLITADAPPHEARALLARALEIATLVEEQATAADGFGPEQREAWVSKLAAALDPVVVERLARRAFFASLPVWVRSAAAQPDAQTTVVVQLGPAWLTLDHRSREAQAWELWQEWAIAVSPGYHNAARLTLVDKSGKIVGGSGELGAAIWVE